MKQIKSHGGNVNNRIISLIQIVKLSLSTVVSAAIFDMPVVNKSAVQEIAFYTVKGNDLNSAAIISNRARCATRYIARNDDNFIAGIQQSKILYRRRYSH